LGLFYLSRGNIASSNISFLILGPTESQPMSFTSNKLDSITFDKLLEAGRHFETEHCSFDLSGISLITPAALVQLAAACYALMRERRQPTITIDNVEVYKYLKRTGFIDLVKPVARIQNKAFIPSLLAYSISARTNPLLLEVTRISSSAAISDCLERVIQILREQLNYRNTDTYEVATAMSEICQNIFEHNSTSDGFVAMQVYGKPTKNQFLEIGIADYGEGLAMTLKRNPKNLPINSDLEAIRLAIKSRVSQFSDDPTRGTGLGQTLNIAIKHEGTIQIRSGSAAMRFRMDKRQGYGFQVAYMPGVQVTLTLPLRSKK